MFIYHLVKVLRRCAVRWRRQSTSRFGVPTAADRTVASPSPRSCSIASPPDLAAPRCRRPGKVYGRHAVRSSDAMLCSRPRLTVPPGGLVSAGSASALVRSAQRAHRHAMATRTCRRDHHPSGCTAERPRHSPAAESLSLGAVSRSLTNGRNNNRRGALPSSTLARSTWRTTGTRDSRTHRQPSGSCRHVQRGGGRHTDGATQAPHRRRTGCISSI